MGAAGKMTAALVTGNAGIVAGLAAGMAVSVLVYGAAVMVLGCINREEAGQIPLLGKLVRKCQGKEK